jgi:hypothetical protein
LWQLELLDVVTVLDEDVLVAALELVDVVVVLELSPPPLLLELLQASAAMPIETAVRPAKTQAMLRDFITLCLSGSTHAGAPSVLGATPGKGHAFPGQSTARPSQVREVRARVRCR